MSKMFKNKSGLSLVEVVIASSIMLSLCLVFVSINVTYYRTSSTSVKTIKAIYLLEEGAEAVNYLKDKDWNNLGSVGTNYYLTWSNSAWKATTTKVYIDQIFERKYFFENVNRNANNDITLAGGTLDPNTKKLTVQITWSDINGTTTKSVSTYLIKPNV